MKQLQFTFVALLSVLFSAPLSSCNKDKTQTEPPEKASAEDRPSTPTMRSGMPGNGPGMMGQVRADCPMEVQGTDVTAADTEGGVALTFKTETGDVADLRTRVGHMAERYEMHPGQAGMMWHQMGSKGMGHHGPQMGGDGRGHMADRGLMPKATATMKDTDLGAKLELRPADPSQLASLREHVRWHQQRMHSGECWTRQAPPTATPHGEEE